MSNWNFLNGGGNDVEVEMRSFMTVISFSVVQERSTACNGKKRKFRCSNDLIRRIDKVTSDWDCVVILQHFDRKTTAAERIGLRWYVVILSCLVSIWRDYTQSPIIRNGPIRLGIEFWGKFKKRALGRPDLRNAWKNLRNTERSDFHS